MKIAIGMLFLIILAISYVTYSSVISDNRPNEIINKDSESIYHGKNGANGVPGENGQDGEDGKNGGNGGNGGHGRIGLI